MSNDCRLVVVTGASGGIGRAVCARLAQSERGLVLAARAEGRLLARCDELRRSAQAAMQRSSGVTE
ncbi:SDR family NAD(P)-dependent oxidoreductase [Variovorax sp. RA8]|uniref:SDR family NAD(P)-dependent oxidoreductase n=1 Tax=Variovorax sp. (strain JCM 16519 / RA8) TaxID=662548 RepID=UPI0013A5B9C9|nr:SDR family NAD(P)-dependent oxidoreductase [Variovorax sp. RA8]